ncbi:MAG: hypothetical protein QXW73_10245 [Nitrososphaerales archaeon]
MKDEASKVRNPHQSLKPNERISGVMLAESPQETTNTRIQWNSETIYKYNRKIEHILKRLESSKHYGLESFIVALKLSGLSLGRV